MMVAHAFPPTLGGVESHVADVAASLAGRGHSVSCLVGGPAPVDEAAPEFRIHRRPELQARCLNSGDASDIGPISELFGPFLDRYRPEVVHAHNAHHFTARLAGGLFEAAACSGGRPGPALINGVHDHVGNAVCPEVLDNFAWRRVLYVSECTRKALPSRHPSTVLHLGIDLRQFRPGAEQHPALTGLERPVIFHPARLLAWKGVEQGLEAFIAIRRRLGTGTLVMCASQDIVQLDSETAELRGRLERRAEKAGIAHCVRYLSFRREEMPAAYRSCDLVWYPTIDEEPFGLVPLEAAGCGVPVVVTQSGGMVETTIPGRTALVVPKGDSAALAGAALAVLGDISLRSGLVRNAAEHVRRFSLEGYVDRLQDVYAASLGARGADRSGG